MDSKPENYLHYISLQTYRSLVDIDSIDREETLKLDFISNLLLCNQS